MPSNRIGFRPFRNALERNPKETALIVDSNVIIAYFDEVHALHEKVVEFLDDLDELADITLYTTVTTKSEFLEYHRRRLLTEALISLEEDRSFPIGLGSRAKIATTKGLRDSRENKEKERVEKSGDLDFDATVSYFNDKEIKTIKKAFRARDIPQETGWLKICQIYLKDQLAELERQIDEFCTYLSSHEEKQKALFRKPKVEWAEATRISGTTGTGYSDALILNMFLHTHIPYLVSLDFDLVYAGAVDAKDKKIVLPDNRIAEFKPILKGV